MRLKDENLRSKEKILIKIEELLCGNGTLFGSSHRNIEAFQELHQRCLIHAIHHCHASCQEVQYATSRRNGSK